MDLFVWFSDENEIVSYHLTYNNSSDEKALTWSLTHGFSHLGVDDGARPGKHPASPLLVKDELFNPSEIVIMLRKNSGDLKPSIESLIILGIEKHYAKFASVI